MMESTPPELESIPHRLCGATIKLISSSSESFDLLRLLLGSRGRDSSIRYSCLSYMLRSSSDESLLTTCTPSGPE
jgi:hypothetical protein